MDVNRRYNLAPNSNREAEWLAQSTRILTRAEKSKGPDIARRQQGAFSRALSQAGATLETRLPYMFV